MKSTTVRLDAEVDVVALGGRSGCLWTSGQIVLAGVGEAVRIPLDRPRGAAAAQAALAELSGADDVDVAGSGPVGFAALAFDPTRSGELIVPEITVGADHDGRCWLTLTGDGSLEVDDALERIETITVTSPQVTEPSHYDLHAPVDPQRWCDEVVAVARERIRSGELGKAVLARALELVTDQPIDISAVVAQLVQGFPSAMVFAVDGFVGASPELLVSRSGDVVRAHPLAGTAARSSDPRRDQQQAAGLLASAKDRTEHRITIDWLLDTLLPWCSYVDAEPEPSIVSLANVHHLGTLVAGRLSSPPASILELVADLHPTPAVGGDPQSTALALIAELEPGERGRYAGPVGWVDARGNGAFAVGIRSAEIRGNRATLHAGVGVVADSDPVAELAETRAKFQAMLGVLLRP